MDIDKMLGIGTFILSFLVSISTIMLNRQQRKVAKIDERLKKEQLRQKKKRPSSPSTKRKKNSRK